LVVSQVSSGSFADGSLIEASGVRTGQVFLEHLKNPRRRKERDDDYCRSSRRLKLVNQGIGALELPIRVGLVHIPSNQIPATSP